MGRIPCCEKIGIKRGPWTKQEDQKLIAYVTRHGHGSWKALPKKAGLLRCGKSCRLRWTNYLRPDIKRGEFTSNEEQTIIQLHKLLGNRWSTIAAHLPKRTDNEIKNHWNTHLKKRLLKMGIDPITHIVKLDPITLNDKNDPLDTPVNHTNNSNYHMVQWESVRLEAEARLSQEAKLRSKGIWKKISPSLSWNCMDSQPPNEQEASLKVIDGDCRSFNPIENLFNLSTTNLMVHRVHNVETSLGAMKGGHLSSCNVNGACMSSKPIVKARVSSDTNTQAQMFRQELSSFDYSLPLYHDSPTSTLTSLDTTPMEKQSPLITSTSSSPPCNYSLRGEFNTKKLSWADILLNGANTTLSREPTKALCENKGIRKGVSLQLSSLVHNIDDEDNIGLMRSNMSKREEKVVNLGSDAFLTNVLTYNSSNLLDLELELTHDNVLGTPSNSITTQQSSSESREHNVNCEACYNHSVLPDEEEYVDDCYWNSMLHEVVDSEIMIDAPIFL